MDKTVLQKIDERERMSDADFAALFAQLDKVEAVAPIEVGFKRLCRAMDEMRRREKLNRL